jgi:hypothetical protein
MQVGGNRNCQCTTLAAALIESARAVQAQQDEATEIARPTASVQKQLAPLLANAKAASREITCPHCNEKFDVSYKTDDVTSVSDDNDDVNGQDDDDDDDYNNRRPIDRSNALARSIAAATERAQR